MSPLTEQENQNKSTQQLYLTAADQQVNFQSSGLCFPEMNGGSMALGERSNEPRIMPLGKVKIQLDQFRTSSEARRKKRKPSHPFVLPKESNERDVEIKQQKKREADKKYRERIRIKLNELEWMKPRYSRLVEVVSRIGGIQIKEADCDMFRSLIEELEGRSIRLEELKTKYGGIEVMEATFIRLEELKSKNDGIEAMLGKYIEMEAEVSKLNQIKSKLGIQTTESILDKFKEMEDELDSFHQINSSFGTTVDHEIDSGSNRLKKIELQVEKHTQMVNQHQLKSFQASPYSDVLVDHLINGVTDENVPSTFQPRSFKDLFEGAQWESVSFSKV